MLSGGAEGIKHALNGFDSARQADLTNERMPGTGPSPPSSPGKKIEIKPMKMKTSGNAAVGTGTPASSTAANTVTATVKDPYANQPGSPPPPGIKHIRVSSADKGQPATGTITKVTVAAKAAPSPTASSSSTAKK